MGIAANATYFHADKSSTYKNTRKRIISIYPTGETTVRIGTWHSRCNS